MSVQDRRREFERDQRDFFDALITEDWSSYLTPESTALWGYEARLLLQGARPRTILDAGCGCGFHDGEMAKRDFVKRILAVDYSEKSVERARREFGNAKTEFRATDFFSMKTDETFDLVTSFQVIEHLDNPGDFLSRCREFSGAGGRVAVFTVDRNRPYNRIRAKHGKPPEKDDPMHHTEFTLEELRDLGKDCGLVAVKACHYAATRPQWLPPRWRAAWGRLFPWTGTRLFVLFRKADA